MLIGIVIGPLFSWVTPADFGVVGSVFASLTLVFILFESGTDTSIQNLRDSWKNLVQVAIPSFFLSVVLVGILGYTLFDLELNNFDDTLKQGWPFEKEGKEYFF